MEHHHIPLVKHQVLGQQFSDVAKLKNYSLSLFSPHNRIWVGKKQNSILFHYSKNFFHCYYSIEVTFPGSILV